MKDSPIDPGKTTDTPPVDADASLEPADSMQIDPQKTAEKGNDVEPGLELQEIWETPEDKKKRILLRRQRTRYVLHTHIHRGQMCSLALVITFGANSACLRNN